MVNSNTIFKKQPSGKASTIAIRCLVAIILLNIIMAFIAILIQDSAGVLVKIFLSVSLFLLPALIAVGNFRYIERYSLVVKIFSWASIVGSVLSVIFGIVLIWDTGSVFAIDSLDRAVETRTPTSLDDDYNYDYYYDYDYDYDYDYGNDYDYDFYDYDDYDYSLYDYDDYETIPSYRTGEFSISSLISPILKIYLVSSTTMLVAFFIASCLKHKNTSPSILGLKIAAIVCIAYCYISLLAFVLFPIPLGEMTMRFAELAAVLMNFGFYSWLALTLIARSERNQAEIRGSKTVAIEPATPAEADNTKAEPDDIKSEPASSDGTIAEAKPETAGDTLDAFEPIQNSSPSAMPEPDQTGSA